jgi:8-oxo-dGTP diphosphatase
MPTQQKRSFVPMPTNHPPVICTVDVVLLTLHNGCLHVALWPRDKEPFAGALALPGGYIHAQDDANTLASAARVLQDKVGVQAPYLEQLATFSGAQRDPRGWSLAVAYCALVPPQVLPLARLGEAAHAPSDMQLVPVDAVPTLPFDHNTIVQAAVQRVRSKSQYSSMPVHLCQQPFTLPQLQAVYEAVLGEPLNKVSFRRKMDELALLTPVQGQAGLQTGAAHRPAQLYTVQHAYQQQLALSTRGL